MIRRGGQPLFLAAIALLLDPVGARFETAVAGAAGPSGAQSATIPDHRKVERRRLSQASDDHPLSPVIVADQYEISNGGEAFALFLGVMYCFAFLAIVCEEFFVPSLEVLAERAELSEDVAGATFMAAGGSAPEFFTSLIGCMWLTESDVGVGTILGSAVFNVLFVIGACGIVSPEPLKLSWWPLFRDSLWYAFALLCVLFTFLDGKVFPAEAALLFLVYVAYCCFMARSETIEQAICDQWEESAGQPLAQRILGLCSLALGRGATHVEALSPTEAGGRDPAGSPTLLEEAGMNEHEPPLPEEAPGTCAQERQISGGSNPPSPTNQPVTPTRNGRHSRALKKTQSFDDGGTVRGRDSHRGMPTSGEHAGGRTSQHGRVIFKPMRSSLKRHDSVSSSVHLGKEEKTTFKFRRKRANTITNLLNEPMAAQIATIANRAMLEQGEGGGDHAEPSKRAWDSLVPVDSPDDEADEIDPTSPNGRHSAIKNAPLAADAEMNQNTSGIPAITPPDGPTIDEDDDEDEARPLELVFPTSMKRRAIFIVTFPILVTLLYTVPDVRRPERKKWYALSFGASLLYISVAAAYMVKWASILAAWVGIEVRILGLTLLAAGTSVPDLLASVIVAKVGKGDMAVSSSIGSNIFDVLVGLPVPWMVYTAWNNGRPMGIYTDNMIFSTLVLLLMLLTTVGLVVKAEWVLFRNTGYLMLGLYLVFISQACALSLAEVKLF
ncbi:unnamed protein product [Amoebophrya sp. A120]|nr:unnamed protein product [Amoebophrya sp. A120]|eukprot:GSA120T00005459001.1